MKVKIIFVCAGIAFVVFIVFAVLVFRSVQNSHKTEVLREAAAEEKIPEEEENSVSLEESMLMEEAKKERERFFREYGKSIPLETMLVQIRIRKAYEENYGSTYDLEEVFLAEETQDRNVGDGGMTREDDIQEQIALYTEKYSIDISRYEGMNPEEQLRAMQVEYGRLDDETDSAYYVPSEDEAGEEVLTEKKELSGDKEDTKDEGEETP